MDRLRRLVGENDPACRHLDQVSVVDGSSDVCPECLVEETQWVHLRMCLVCGKPGCCNSSPMQHSRRHFEETGHALVRSLEPREDWAWCQVDEIYLKPRDYRP